MLYFYVIFVSLPYFIIVCEKQNFITSSKMAGPNMSDPFFTDIVVVFLGNVWQTNAMINCDISGTENSTITFLSSPNALIIIEG